MKYPVQINKTEHGFDAHCPVLAGCHSQGDSLAEAVENIKDAIRTYLLIIEEETKQPSDYEVEVSV
ncbi:Uncharacterized protein family UPF0150 domain protein [Candidatus Magnetoovum chiemensis]|nr:Uncharacterized protein family UPF0150 domain protein [Candidatus Magnetoovum chiemensis]